MTFLQFALLGLGAGGAYAIAGLGLTQVYRGSGVLNLAHGALAFVAAVLFVRANSEWGWAAGPSAAIAIGAATAIGLAVHVLVMHPLRNAANLVRVISTLGVFAIVQQGVPLVFGTDFQKMKIRSFYPTGHISLGDSVSLSYDRIIVIGVTVTIGAILWVGSSRTRFGLATTASAENALVSSSMGVSPSIVAASNWVIGSGLAGIAGVLLIPIVNTMAPPPMIFLVVPGLSAAMIGRFRSYWLTIAGGVAIGVGQSLLTRYQGSILPDKLASGWPDALPFLVIIVVLVVGGTPFPKRGEVVARLPRIGRSTMRTSVALAAIVAVAAACLRTSNSLAGALSGIAALAIVGLSLVVVTGLAGQTSLAQLSISGVAALIAGRLSGQAHWPFLLVLLVGVVAGSAVGLLFALPSLRTRGPTLAIATLGVGIAIESVVLKNGTLTNGGFSGTPIDKPTLFGLDVNGVDHPGRYAALVVVFLGLAAIAVNNLRSSPTGRRLMAMRSSERAALATGISLTSSKIAAFTIGAGLASLGGILIGFQFTDVTYQQYGLLSSLMLVILSLIGGIGYVAGPILGAAMSPTGIVAWLLDDHDTVDRWLTVLSGFTLILTLISYHHGLASAAGAFADRVRSKRRRPLAPSGRATPASPARRATLVVDGLSVQYGSTIALHELHLTVEPGQIVGLIGPNGAGKTTAIDAISGFARSTGGTVRLGAADLGDRRPNARALAGMARSFQTVEPFADLSVAENLAIATEQSRWYHWISDLIVRRPVALRDDIRDEAQRLGLVDLDAEPDTLSQGQRRLLGVLRAMSSSPSVLLLDEPAAGLDRTETARLGEILREVAAARGVGMLLVEHDMELVVQICDRVIAIDFGRTIFDGDPHHALADPLIRAAYLGDLDEDEAAEGEEAQLEQVHS